jgi:hypothetical protein
VNAVIDTFTEAVRDRIVALNPSRKVLGVLDRRDWPPQDVAMEAFYCLVLGASPLGKQAFSAQNQWYVFTCQWVWMIAGTDTQAGLRGLSRGDRGRKHRQMLQELAHGLYPFFAQKKTFSMAGATMQSAPAVPTESITWTLPVLVDKVDQESGLVYGTATVYVSGCADAIDS